MAEPLDQFDPSMTGEAFAHLPVRFDHAPAAGLLGGGQRNCFDGFLAPQASTGGVAVLIRDRQLAGFERYVLW